MTIPYIVLLVFMLVGALGVGTKTHDKNLKQEIKSQSLKTNKAKNIEKIETGDTSWEEFKKFADEYEKQNKQDTEFYLLDEK